MVLSSSVTRIEPDAVHMQIEGRGDRPVVIENDDVFILAGGIPPFKLLERSGVSFDPPGERSASRYGSVAVGCVRRFW